MRTRSQIRNRNRQQQSQQVVVQPFHLEDPFVNPPLVPMADNRTMAQLLQAPHEGYDDAIELHQLDTFYNALTALMIKDSLNSAAVLFQVKPNRQNPETSMDKVQKPSSENTAQVPPPEDHDSIFIEIPKPKDKKTVPESNSLKPDSYQPKLPYPERMKVREKDKPSAQQSSSIIESLPVSPIPVEDSEPVQEEIDIFLVPDDLISPGVENDDSEDEDNELPNLDHQDNPSDVSSSSLRKHTVTCFAVRRLVSQYDMKNDEDFKPGGNFLSLICG
ncbi:hypothetical protein Tco_0568515 [Tanacetum coccineum]